MIRKVKAFKYKFPREENLKLQCLTKIKQKYVVVIKRRMRRAYCFGLNAGWKKIRFQLALNKTFFPTQHPFTQRRFTGNKN